MNTIHSNLLAIACLILSTPAISAPILPPAMSQTTVNCGSGEIHNDGVGERSIDCGTFAITSMAETIGLSTTINPGFDTIGSSQLQLRLFNSGQIGSADATIEYFLAVDPGSSGATSIDIDIDIRHAVVANTTNVSNGVASGGATTQIGLNGFAGALLYDVETQSTNLRKDFSDTFRFSLGINDALAIRSIAGCSATNLFGPADVNCTVLADPIFTIVDPDIAAQASLVFSDSLIQAVPVPAAVWLFGSGLLGLVLVGRTRSS